MTADETLRLAERRGDRAELVRAMVRAGLGREAVARCGLHVGDVVRRVRDPWPERPAPCPTLGALLRVAGAHTFTFRDPEAHLGVATRRLEGNERRGDGPQVLARTLDLVEPGDGEQVLAPQHLTSILTPADRG